MRRREILRRASPPPSHEAPAATVSSGTSRGYSCGRYGILFPIAEQILDAGVFAWRYLEEGPEVWRVEIRKA